MPRHHLLLFCLVSSQLAVTAVMARRLSIFDGGAVLADAPFGGGGGGGGGDSWSSTTDRPRARSLLEPGGLAGSPLPLGLSHDGARRPFDKTFTGGKIILVGLAAAIVGSVFCYIRITRAKKNTEPKT